MKAVRLGPALVCVLLLMGCSSTPAPAPTQTAQPEKKTAVAYTGRACFTRMSDMAIRWQPDALAVHLESDINSESNGQDGKATVWRALFASPSRGRTKTFICSGSVLPDAPPFGVTSTAESAYSSDIPALFFPAAYLQLDSDKAVEETRKRGGDRLLKKDPKQDIVYVLEWEPKQKELLWSVVYGKSLKDFKSVGILNARTGKFLAARNP